MKKTLQYGLVLLVAAAMPYAYASGPDSARFTFFFLTGAPAVHTEQGYLGVDVRDVTDDQMAALKLKQARGAEIILVDHDAPAGKVGLREHDVILRVNGQAIEGEDQLRRMLRESSPGMQLTLVISRDGQQMSVTTQTANREVVERQAWEQHLTVPEPLPSDNPVGEFYPSVSTTVPTMRGGNNFISPMLMNPSYTGAMLETMSSQLADFFGVVGSGGLLVRSVEANSPAAQAGMRAGDVVVRANEKAVANSADWTKAIKDSHGRPVTVVVLRDKKEQTISLTPDNKKRSSMEQPGEGTQSVAQAPFGYFWLQLP